MPEQQSQLVPPAPVMAATMAGAGTVVVQGHDITPFHRCAFYASLWPAGSMQRSYWHDVYTALLSIDGAQEPKP
jgi:hypothetical protein